MTISLSLNDVQDLTNTVTAESTINANNADIKTAFTSALAVTGDKMQGTLDMNSNRIINLPAPASQTEPIRLIDFTGTGTLAIPSVTLSGVVTGTSSGGSVVTSFSGTGNLPVSQLAAGSGASTSTFWRGDGSWANPGSASVTAGANIVVSGTNPASISIQTTLTNYTYIQGQAATGGASILVGNATDASVYIRSGILFLQNAAGTTQNVINGGTFLLGSVGTVDGAIQFARATGTSTVAIQAAQTSTAYTLILPTSLAAAGGVFVSGGAAAPTTWSSISTTSGQRFQSVSGGTPTWSTSVWPSDVTTTNQILVCSANHTWSASQTVTNLTLTTPTLTTATMTGTTVLVNATMSGNLTFSSGTIGVLGCTDTSSGAAGQIGEYVSSSVASVAAVPLLSDTASAIVSIVLTPGDWDITANAAFLTHDTTSTFNYLISSINNTVANNIVPGAFSNNVFPGTGIQVAASSVGTLLSLFTGPFRASLAATATYSNVMFAHFTGSIGGYGTIRARRVR